MVSLELVEVVPYDPNAFTTDRGRIDFRTEAYRGKPDRIIVWQGYSSYGLSQSGTPAAPKKGGITSFYFQINAGPNTTIRWEAWVAAKGDWATPISEILTGTL